jgi:ribosomal protein S18 acetylase RimI-like enzyme
MSGIMNLRPARPEDEPFLRQLRGQVDADRLCMNLWRGDDADVEKAKILDLQFRAQTAHHNVLKANWETKENIIEMDGVPIGRFVITGGSEELRLAEIAIVKEWRGKGIGQIVIGTTKKECERSGRVLRLCVEKTNQRAISLYLAQGFYVIENEPTHFIMEWSAKGPTGGKVHYFATTK